MVQQTCWLTLLFISWILGASAMAQTVYFKADHLYLGRAGQPIAISADVVPGIHKPFGIPTINAAHPLAANLTAFWLMNEGAGTLIRNVINPGVYDVQLEDLAYQHWDTLPGSGDVGIFCENLSNNKSGLLTPPLTTTETFTWHARVNISSTAANYGTLFSANGGTGLYIRPYGSAVKLQFYPTFFNDSPWPIGQWTDLIVVMTSGAFTYYVNGVANGGPYGMSSMDVTNMFNDSWAERMHGYVEFQRIWVGRALTASEVAAAVADPYGVFLP